MESTETLEDYSLDSFVYEYPEQLIADRPADPRDSSRLLVLDRQSNNLTHAHFRDLPRFLKSGDCLVINRTKVWPARLLGKKPTGGKVEMLLLREIKSGTWAALSSDLKLGLRVEFADGVHAEIEGKNPEGGWACRFSTTDVRGFMARHGLPPLPPYILKKRKNEKLSKEKITLTVSRHSKSQDETKDFQTYQTVYAKEEGSVAAPTAGLHFTPELLDRLRGMGIQILEITLHVGQGTFQPITASDVRAHPMKSEWYHIDSETAASLETARKQGTRIIAVGTTATRTLETFAATGRSEDWTSLYIHPGYQFNAIRGLITNFHLPHSTPLVLASAFAGKERLFAAYHDAIQKQYRLYSYGDAMLIL